MLHRTIVSVAKGTVVCRPRRKQKGYAMKKIIVKIFNAYFESFARTQNPGTWMF